MGAAAPLAGALPGGLRQVMFKNLRTSTKLVLLCAVFLVAVGATTYSLVAEKRISIACSQGACRLQFFGNSPRYLFHGPERQRVRIHRGRAWLVYAKHAGSACGGAERCRYQVADG